MSSSQYQAGVCNIGGPEVKRRKQVSQIGAALFLIVAMYLLLTSAKGTSALIAFLPAMIAAVGFVQSRKRFCFAFGLMGTFNFAETGRCRRLLQRQRLQQIAKWRWQLSLSQSGQPSLQLSPWPDFSPYKSFTLSLLHSRGESAILEM